MISMDSDINTIRVVAVFIMQDVPMKWAIPHPPSSSSSWEHGAQLSGDHVDLTRHRRRAADSFDATQVTSAFRNCLSLELRRELFIFH